MPFKTPVDVLLVEDDQNDADLAKRILSNAKNSDYHVVHVSDGLEATNYVSEQRAAAVPRLVLLDLKLPKFDGFTVLERVRVQPGWAAVPVVILSSSSIDSDISKSYELGANAFVVKPITYDRYKEAMENIAKFWLETAS